MSEKRRVLASNSQSSTSSETPTRPGLAGVRSSPSVIVAAGSGSGGGPLLPGRARVTNAAAIINKSVSSSSSNVNNSPAGISGGGRSTPAGAVRATPTSASSSSNRQAASTSTSTFSPGVSAVRARVLGYGGQQQEGSPLAQASSKAAPSSSIATAYRGPSTPSASSSSSSTLGGPVTTPSTSFVPPVGHSSSSTSSSTSSATAAAAARASPFGSNVNTPNAAVVTPVTRIANGNNASGLRGATTPSTTSAVAASASAKTQPSLTRKVRAASTPPSALDSPSYSNSPAVSNSNNHGIPRPASPRRRAFPAFQSASADSYGAALSSSPSPSPLASAGGTSNANGSAGIPKVRTRGISNRLDASTHRTTSTTPSFSSTSRPGIVGASGSKSTEPSRPPFSHAHSSSKSMTSRPVSANLNTLLPSPTIRTSASTIFSSNNNATASSSSSSSSAPVARGLPSPSTSAMTPGRSPSPANHTGPARAHSPMRSQYQANLPPARSTSPVRPISPLKNVPFKPVLSSAALQGSSPRRPARLETTSSTASVSTSRNANLDTAGPCSPMTAKRPSTSSQSSSAYSNTTADTSGTTAATSPDNHHPFSDSYKASASIHALKGSSSSNSNAYHRTRRRSQSTSSSMSSVSALSGASASRGSGKSPSSGIASTRPRGNSQATLQQSMRVPANGVIAYGSPGLGQVGIAAGAGATLPAVTTSPTAISPVGISSPGAMAPDLSPSLLSSPPGKGSLSEMERKAHAEAKVNRKILDLEITNTSLLAINNSLEKAKAKQANEIRDLRRRLRDRSLAPIHSAPLLGASAIHGGADGYDWQDGDGADDYDALEAELTWEEILKQDERFADMVRLLEGMKTRAKEALEKTVKSEEKTLGGRVLNAFSMSLPSLPGAMAGATAAGTPGSGGATASISTSASNASRKGRAGGGEILDAPLAGVREGNKNRNDPGIDTSTITVASISTDAEVDDNDDDQSGSLDTSKASLTASSLTSMRKSTPRTSDASEGFSTSSTEASGDGEGEGEGENSGTSSSFDVSRAISSSEFSISID